ncbi:alanine dehydrogenase [Labilibaculum filiforme]|uniref:alanine dehydrogenase n=1 Tax=Labilibaculum filiforme TaxID=1940526 RepID=A0A2N3HXK5_9BACT|nr:alanine dehydrogenase [Labilibaculum filiforme]PKQ62792.1 alanine dehydrogenase [Labilibaculum filiforme]
MAPLSQGSRNFPIGHKIYQPKEEMLEIERRRKQLAIGIPREDGKGENRICLTPQSVEVLVNNGHDVMIERGAGLASNYTDKEYSENGAQIVNAKSEIYQCDVVMQVSPFSSAEIDMLRGNQILFSALQIKSQCCENIRKLMQKKVTAIAMELVKDENNFFPVVRSMSEIAGISAVMIAGEYLSKAHGGKGVMLGGITGITPTEVIVLGAGTASEYATRAAMGLGAMVKVFDDSIYRLRRLEDHLGHRVFTSIFHPHVLEKALASADVVIGALRYEKNVSGFIVTEDMVAKMKPGSIIIDLSIDQGGCFETSMMTTHKDPVFKKHGVLHYCVPNVPSHVSRTASLALSNICSPLLLQIGNNGGVHQFIKRDIGLRHGTYIYRGILTNRRLGDSFGILAKDIDLLLAAM